MRKIANILTVVALMGIAFGQTYTFKTIAEIQDTTGTGGDSNFHGDTLKTTGVVTATDGSNYWVQDGSGPWNGILVYQSGNTAAVGDSVDIVAEIDEYFGETELVNIISYTVLDSNIALPSADTVTTEVAGSEAYEGTLIYTMGVVTDPDLGYGEFEINDGSGALVLDDKIYKFTPDSASSYTFMGVGTYSFGAYKLLPRSASDIGVKTTFAVDMSNETVSANGVHIAGGMNGWSTTASEMTDDNSDGIYEATFYLEPGSTVAYTFLNGNDWANQEDNSNLALCGSDNGFGAYNRIYVVGNGDGDAGAPLFGSCLADGEVYLTFQVDMANETAGDTISVAGSFNGWNSTATIMTDADSNGVYTAKIIATSGDTLYFKYVNDVDGWENVPSECASGGNRMAVVGEADATLDIVCFGGCSSCAPPVEATLTFQADVTDMAGFDPSAGHYIEVRGSFNGWGAGSVMEADLTNPNLFLYDTTLTMVVGSEINWKFKAAPDSAWSNGGWENGDNKVVAWTGENIVLDATTPNIVAAGQPLDNDVTFNFVVYWEEGTINANFDTAFYQAPDSIVFNGTYGNGWYTWGNCLDSCDTPAAADMPRLSDGDGDGIYTGSMTLAAGEDNVILGKFGAWYDGIEAEGAGGNGNIDNEAGFGADRVIIVPVDATEFTYTARFGENNPNNPWIATLGEIVSTVPDRFELLGNYPNPFNPSTQIAFSLDKSSDIKVTIYSLLGQEVATISKGMTGPGNHTVSWQGRDNAGRLVPSGVYLYRVTSENRALTGKMMLMK